MLLAAAALVTLGAGVAALVGPDLGHGSSAGRPVGGRPSPVVSTVASTAGSMPASSKALITYVRGGQGADAARFEEGSPARSQPMSPTPGIVEFTSPSGNITCALTGGTGRTLASCEAAQHSFPTPPRPASCRLNWGASWVSVDGGLVNRGLCLGGVPFDPISNTLPYGSTLTFGSVTCRSESAFLACADVGTGRGFALDRATLRTY